MKIGINLLYLIPDIVGGTETYASGLLHGLAIIDQHDEFVIYVNQESKNWPLPEQPNFIRVVCPVSAFSQTRRYLFEQLQFPKLLRKNRIDIVHSLGYVSPLFAPCSSIVTIHDINYRAFGDAMPISRRWALAFFVKESARRANRVITVSEFSQREILKAFNLPSNRVIVTHEAPRISSKLNTNEDLLVPTFNRLGIKCPYIIAFSSQSPNKNIPRLLSAFSYAREQYKLPHQLVLVGHQPVDQLLNFIPSDDAILFTGYLDDSTLQTVLSHAQILVFPSLYEGFGLPVLEAMVSGVPVVCSDKASLPEICGDAVEFFDPLSVKDMAKKIVQVVLDPVLQEILREKGFKNVKRFSWEKAARKTLSVYKDVFNKCTST
jgi:glycosyltransferase involved in cell wall biosynthesis